jgi:hypothetical protein
MKACRVPSLKVAALGEINSTATTPVNTSSGNLPQLSYGTSETVAFNVTNDGAGDVEGKASGVVDTIWPVGYGIGLGV